MGWGSCRSLGDGVRDVYWVGGRTQQIPSPYGVGGETGYTAPLMGGKDDPGLVFPFPPSRTLLGSICFFILGSPQGGSEQGLSSCTSFVEEETLP